MNENAVVESSSASTTADEMEEKRSRLCDSPKRCESPSESGGKSEKRSSGGSGDMNKKTPRIFYS